MTLNIQNQRNSVLTQVTDPARVAWLPSAQQALASEIEAAHEICVNAVRAGNKDYLRALHYIAREKAELIGSADKLQQYFAQHKSWFKSGSEINPERIQPRLKLIETVQDEQLWWLAKTCWSMPYSKGYGRRLRFLVIDEEHQGLIGILGLQSPPADLKCRDDLFSYPKGLKLKLVNQTMDAFTIGALPPYSFLLGGKLCAGLLASDEVREAYWRKYAAKRTLMQNKLIEQPLVGITTTSAFGRSSIYNRLKVGQRVLARPIGYTKGYGLLHLEHLYPKISQFLESCGALTPNGYGNGPKVRWQNVTKALILMGLSPDLLHHGVQREVFLFNLVEDLEEGMAGGSFGHPLQLQADEFSDFWRRRWALPRAGRYPAWKTIDANKLVEQKVAVWTSIASRSLA